MQRLVGMTAVIALFLAAPSVAFGDGITATGYGHAVTAPDMVFLRFSTQSREVDRAQVLKANAEVVDKVAKDLKAAGIAPADIQTGDFNMTDVREPYNCGQYDSNQGEIIPCTFDGFELSTAITLRIRKLDTFGPVVAAAIAAGAGNMNGLTLTVANAAQLQDEAYAAALADARRRAELTATTLGVKLGALTSAEEATRSDRGGPATLASGIDVGYNAEGYADLAILPYGEIISGGELTFNSAATVTYQIAE